MMAAKILPLTIGLATGVLALNYALSGLWSGMLLILALGLLWLIGQGRGWGGVASATFVVFVGAAVIGLWLGLAAIWMLLGVVAVLTAWDLDRFAGRLRDVGQVEGVQALERHHLQRLVVVDGLGLLLAAVALRIEINLSFGVTFLLGLLAVLGLSRVIGTLRSASDQ